MVPDKFDMVDMGGIDLLESQGVSVDGLYQRLVESITLCRYQCLYNWKFNGILIPPSYVEMEIREDGVWINEGVMVDKNDVIYIITGEPPVPIEPVIEPLSVIKNGTYTATSGVDGYNPVTVNVPQEEPSLQSLTVTENGSYLPTVGYVGFDSVEVNVPQSVASPVLLWDFTESLTDEITGATAILGGNGTAQSSQGVLLKSPGSYINLVNLVYPSARKIEIEIGDINFSARSDHARFLMVNSEKGLIFRSNGRWSFYAGSWAADSDITNPAFFANSIMTVEIDIRGFWKIYKDETLVYSPSNPLRSGSILIGANSYSFYEAYIKSVKVY